ncbi:Carboxysome shell peptide mid-region [Nitrosomonas eutropha]|uniref:Carboxysome shell peptide mid-region n=1 Tax=Nitrosomonas eutropha TaxID=916 RepID=A0A1I7J8W0_9PROT|nr:CsoS2 family carboxysome shell protein [Nitrosomonas eutropha]SFU81613.1 Carboxysome shell peptide mid-region [Nitrosomonas eutropha]
MTIAASGYANANLSGRELALQRRQAMARQGKAAIAKTSAQCSADITMNAGKAATAWYSSRIPVTAAVSVAQVLTRTEPLPAAAVSAARARRQALASVGKAALQTAKNQTRPSAHLRPSAAIRCDCDAQCECRTQHASSGEELIQRAAAAEVSMTMVAAVQESVQRATVVAEQATGRALAKMRRAALTQDGKAGLKRVAQATKIAAAMPGQDWQAAMIKGATGRQIAMRHRRVQSLAGRAGLSSSAASRPKGRIKTSDDKQVPIKVEEGHTLSGQAVTGTMVERSIKVTGNEPGSCRSITGTEYIGTEQFQTICGVRAEPGVSKVEMSRTLREQRITGTALGRSTKTTGDEAGVCHPVTGTEYLSTELFKQFCGTRPAPSPEKVALVSTDEGMTVSGSLVDRPRKITGAEYGADQSITGTRYGRPPESDNAPNKIAITHTGSGKTVTGTLVGRSERLTGDEAGSCRVITGTEYLSAEQFSDLCHTNAPTVPRKVSVMSTHGAQAISGASVDRSSKVTGNEVGSCRAITGSQYYTTADFAGLCDASGPNKVSTMHTLAGRVITGSEVAPSPKLTGDESYGCKSVTGTDYISTQQLAAVCPPGQSSTVQSVNKIVFDSTLRGQPVSGSYPGRATNVTGNEAGTCAPISGTQYSGMSQIQEFCPAPSLDAQAARVRDSAVIPASVVTGDRPGAGGSRMTGDERGACEPISGTPYLGPDNMPGQCATSSRFVPRGRTFDVAPQTLAPKDFSIVPPSRHRQAQSPVREYQGDNLTGNALSNNSRITGTINKADGLITGTPEFRHGDTSRGQVRQDEVVAAALRLSGEGSQQGTRISGDAWNTNTRVTGTEGSSSRVRNPSMRGQPRGVGVNAVKFRELERPDVPESVITGSSGNTGRGATITVSGGARG